MLLTPISENLLLRFASPRNGKLQMKHISFESGDELWQAETTFSHVLFPVRGVVSLQISPGRGKQVDIALVGPEGYAEVPVLLGEERTLSVAVALTPGEAMLMTPGQFRTQLNDDRFRAATEHYARVFLIMLNRISVCNRIHVLDKTLVGRLLLLHDRTRTDTFRLTQAFLARILGVRKATISRAAARLQKLGAIDYDRRGNLLILDRAKLERQSCSCYQAMKAASDGLISALGGF
jgi:CRP-like cAMP-binding protein